jgi:hypothetical protein
LPDALVEAWQAPADFDKARDHLCAIVESRMSHYLINAEGVAADSISMECNGSTTTIDILHSRIAKPHIDRHSPEWSALWVLRASSHVMGKADHRPSNPPIARRRPLKSPQLTPGQSGEGGFRQRSNPDAPARDVFESSPLAG